MNTTLVPLSRAAVGLCLALSVAGPAAAQDQNTPYEQKMMRLSEVLGAMHHLRNICGAREGQLWREQMIRLLDAEAPSPARRARLVRQFNKGYQTYQRSYQTCTDSAGIEASKFASEGALLSQSLAFERANY
jgi:uncharacterized protein (TIGR02301 family)